MQTATKLVTANQAAILKACAARPLSYNAIAKHVPDLAKPKRCVDDMAKAGLLWGVGDGEFGATDGGKAKLADYIKANEKPQTADEPKLAALLAETAPERKPPTWTGKPQEAATAPEAKKAFKPATMGTKAAPKAAKAPEAASKPETLSAKLAKLPKTTGSRKADAKAATEAKAPKAAAKPKKAPIEKAAGLRTNTDVPERTKREIELGLSPRQAQAINFVRENKGATVKQINALFGTVSSRLHVLQEGCVKAGLKLASKKEGTTVIWYIEK